MSDGGDQWRGEDAAAYACPGCGETVRVAPGAVAQLVACGACGAEFVVPSVEGSTELPEADEAEGRGRGHEGELDALRMRHVIVQRRAATRSRSYALMGAAACAMGAAKLVLMTYHEVRGGGGGWHPRQVAFVLLAVVAAWGVSYFLGRAAHWARESRGTGIPEPETPPDFSTLSDGSQRVKNLEDIR